MLQVIQAVLDSLEASPIGCLTRTDLASRLAAYPSTQIADAIASLVLQGAIAREGDLIVLL